MLRPLFRAEIGVVPLLLLGAACGRGAMHGRGPDASVVPDVLVVSDLVVALDARDGAPDSARFDLVSSDARPSCGNGRYDPTEECDDGNGLSGDGCSSTCKLECGDAGVGPCIDPGFFPQSPWYLCCTPSKLIVCGDGVLSTIEACDDRNNSSGDGCAGDCKTVERGYRCIVPGMRCTPICGDGEVKGGETCDDGNRNPGDGCSQFCLTEPGWDCSTGGCVRRESNDGGWEVQPPVLYCGDEILSGAEECDCGLANGAVDSVCSADCAYLFCGDGVVTGSEQCDLGRQNGTAYGEDGCTSTCTDPHFCGDGIVDTAYGEECDTGGQGRCTVQCKILWDL
jgi:cysteine-rich repeat protein